MPKEQVVKTKASGVQSHMTGTLNETGILQVTDSGMSSHLPCCLPAVFRNPCGSSREFCMPVFI